MEASEAAGGVVVAAIAEGLGNGAVEIVAVEVNEIEFAGGDQLAQ